MKKLILFLLVGLLAYYLIGFALLYLGQIDKLPVFYKKVIKASGSDDKDLSKTNIDGPYVFYRDNRIICKYVSPKDTGFMLATDMYSSREQTRLNCNVNNSHFEFGLHDTLKVEETIYTMPEKMLVVSDIEGNFPAFTSILRGSGVIDEAYKWTFGKGHIVLLGDFFDRGLNVTETLWLIYKLEAEAEEQGGKVHFILGNHEIMNLYGNLKYVKNKYMENAVMMQEPYMNWYSDGTELGRWLRTKNIAEKIGDIVFVHAGISPEIAKSGLSLEQVNLIARQHIGTKPADITSEPGKLVCNTKLGPYWYRGMVNEELDEDEVTEIMKYLKAGRVVVGHTIVENIKALYTNRVIAIDLHHAKNFEKNIMKALWIESGVFYVIDNLGNKVRLIP